MKTSASAFFLLVFLVTSSVLAAGTTGPGVPYWVRPGATLEYRAFSTHPAGGGFIFNVSGAPVAVTGPNVTVVFRVLDVKNGLALMHVSITVTTGNVSFAPVLVIYPSNSTVRPFWNESSIVAVKALNNYTKVVLSSLRVDGRYRINLTTGWVYDLKGRSYGHTVLWDGFRPNETFAFYHGKRVKVAAVKIANVSMRTYYGTFPKPNVVVHSGRVVTPVTVSSFDAVYSPEYDVCISFMTDPIPDFNAIGVYGFMWTDDKAAKIDTELSEKHGGMVNGMWAWGVILSNATLGRGHSVAVTPPGNSRLRYLAVFLLIVVCVTSAACFERRRR
ncbi:hypothetical protein [Thermococcus prieurii]